MVSMDRGHFQELKESNFQEIKQSNYANSSVSLISNSITAGSITTPPLPFLFQKEKNQKIISCKNDKNYDEPSSFLGNNLKCCRANNTEFPGIDNSKTCLLSNYSSFDLPLDHNKESNGNHSSATFLQLNICEKCEKKDHHQPSIYRPNNNILSLPYYERTHLNNDNYLGRYNTYEYLNNEKDLQYKENESENFSQGLLSSSWTSRHDKLKRTRKKSKHEKIPSNQVLTTKSYYNSKKSSNCFSDLFKTSVKIKLMLLINFLQHRLSKSHLRVVLNQWIGQAKSHLRVVPTQWSARALVLFYSTFLIFFYLGTVNAVSEKSLMPEGQCLSFLLYL